MVEEQPLSTQFEGADLLRLEGDTGDDIGEYVCNENEKDAGHLVGK